MAPSYLYDILYDIWLLDEVFVHLFYGHYYFCYFPQQLCFQFERTQNLCNLRRPSQKKRLQNYAGLYILV